MLPLQQLHHRCNEVAVLLVVDDAANSQRMLCMMCYFKSPPWICKYGSRLQRSSTCDIDHPSLPPPFWPKRSCWAKVTKTRQTQETKLFTAIYLDLLEDYHILLRTCAGLGLILPSMAKQRCCHKDDNQHDNASAMHSLMDRLYLSWTEAQRAPRALRSE